MSLVSCVQLYQFCQAINGVHVFDAVEKRALLPGAVQDDLWVNTPCLDRLFRHTGGNQRLAKVVRLHVSTEPVGTLSERFERGGRCVHAVVADVWDGGKAELFPVAEHKSS